MDGEWQIIFDEHNEGRDAKWYEMDQFQNHPMKQNILVPSAWELTKQDYEGVAFYHSSFRVPQDWEGDVIRLQFEAVNYLAEVWLNDEVVGFHEGGFTPFEFRVDEMTKIGEVNHLTMRVVGPITLTDKIVDGIGPMETPQWRGGLTGGVWQPVRLYATKAILVEDAFLIPNINNNMVTVDATLNHTGLNNQRAELIINITDASDASKSITSLNEQMDLHPGENNLIKELRIDQPKYWSPRNPNLYVASIEVMIDGKRSDLWRDRFGIRELTIKDKRLLFEW